jgi:hypothetical protein
MARVLFNAVCISSAVPSKNLPQPNKEVRIIVTSFRSQLCIQLTSVEQGIASKNCPSSAVFHKEAYAILRMTRRMQCFDIYVTDLEGLPILRCFCDALAVFASNDGSAFEFGVG